MKKYLSVLVATAILAGCLFQAGCDEDPGIPDGYAGDCPDTPEQRMVYVINREREAGGVDVLDIELRLAEAAADQAERMANQQTLTPTAADLTTRLLLVGYSPTWSGENVAGFADSAEGVLEAWLNDSDSRRRLLSTDFLHVGVGYAENLSSPIGYYWAVIFAAADSANIPDSGCHP